MSEESVLLIFPPDKWGNVERFCQPLGVLTLATILKNEGIKVNVIDLSAEGFSPQKLMQIIADGDFTHVGVTVMTPFRRIAYSILQIAKRVDSDIITMVGGPHVTYIKEKIFLESSYIDIAVAGEAEHRIVDIIRNPSKKFYDLGYIKDIDALPFPDRSFVRHIEYNQMTNIWIGDSASMKWVRGCSWRKCRFCSRSVLTMAHRKRSPKEIVEEIAIIQNELKYKNIVVIDDSLRVNSRHTKEVLKLKIQEGLDIPFWSLARADHIDKEGAQLMRRAGATGLLVGVESVVPRVIDMYKKISGNPLDWTRTLSRAFDLADKYQLIIIATFIVGGPSESVEEIQKTIDFCRSAKIDISQPFPFLYLIGSDFWQQAVTNGNIKSDQYYSYNDKSFGTTELSTSEIFDLVLEAEFLTNSPLLNYRKYLRLIRKLVKQRNWSLIGQNIVRLPLIIKDVWGQHTYEMVPEQLHD
jgi:anaerobic magnesium-protoporphyrin IX monomethyl ester cyclase